MKLVHPESRVNHRNHSFVLGWDKLSPCLTFANGGKKNVLKNHWSEWRVIHIKKSVSYLIWSRCNLPISWDSFSPFSLGLNSPPKSCVCTQKSENLLAEYIHSFLVDYLTQVRKGKKCPTFANGGKKNMLYIIR